MQIKEPTRVKIEGKRGLHVVYKGVILEGLGWDKNTRVYYTIYSKPRRWFHRDFSKSYYDFNKWLVKSGKSILLKERNQKRLKVSKEFVAEDGRRDDIHITIPEEEIWNRARDLILTDQLQASKKLGIPEVAHINTITPPPKALTLKEIGEMYINKTIPKPLSKQERKDTVRWWNELCNIVRVETIRDVTEAHIKEYHKIITENATSDVFQKHRLRKIKTILRYTKGEVTYKQDLKKVIGYTDYFNQRYLPPKPSDPTPIERENFFKIYNVADEQYKLIMLTAANCAFTPVDIADLKWSMINLGKKTLKMRRKKKGQVLRIAVLWDRIVRQLRVLKKRSDHSDYVFVNSSGEPYTPNAISCRWSKLRKKAGVRRTEGEPNTFESIRDTAQTEPAAICLDQNIDCLMGHSCGISDKYKHRDPKKLVGKVCKVLHDYYFPKKKT